MKEHRANFIEIASALHGSGSNSAPSKTVTFGSAFLDDCTPVDVTFAPNTLR